MGKKMTSMNIDEKLLLEVKKLGVSMSDLTEKAMKERLGKVEVTIEKGDSCEFCGAKMPKATSSNLNGLVWIYPFEQWICPKCERKLIKKVRDGKTYGF